MPVRYYRLYPDGSYVNSGKRVWPDRWARRVLWLPWSVVYVRLAGLRALQFTIWWLFFSRRTRRRRAMMMPVARLALCEPGRVVSCCRS